MTPAEREAMANPAVPGVPRRGVIGVDHRQLTAEQRARLVVHDPYSNPNNRRPPVGAGETVRVQDPRTARVSDVPVGTDEQRRRVVRDVELGRLFLVATRPGWWAVYTSGRVREHVWPELSREMVTRGTPAAGQVEAREWALAWSARQAQEAYAAARGLAVPPESPSGRG